MYTAALMDPSVRDADTADMEARDRCGRVPFPLSALTPAPDLPGPNVPPTDGIVLGQQMAEALALTELYLLFDGPGAPRPRYVIVGLSTTDGCGEAYGPHGDRMEAVLAHIDDGLGCLLGWLEGWGLLDRTAIVVTADHGMQIGDPTRATDPFAALDAAGIARVPGTGAGVWFPAP